MNPAHLEKIESKNKKIEKEKAKADAVKGNKRQSIHASLNSANSKELCKTMDELLKSGYTLTEEGQMKKNELENCCGLYGVTMDNIISYFLEVGIDLNSVARIDIEDICNHVKSYCQSKQ